MARQRYPHQPTLSNLLSSEALAEAHVLSGGEHLDVPILQVVTTLSAPARAGTLIVQRPASLAQLDDELLSELAGVIAVATPKAGDEGAARQPSDAAGAQGLGQEIERLVLKCSEYDVPVVWLAAFGELWPVAEDIRLAFLAELKSASARMHAALLSTVLDEGLAGVVDKLSDWVSRPVAVETADFKVLAAKNMGPTPGSQQRTLTEEVAEALNRQLRGKDAFLFEKLSPKPFRIGRRLVLPILLSDGVVGYVSVMVRPNEDVEAIGQYLHPASLACMVEFSRRQRDIPALSVTHRSLLKDLLGGRTLSAADQERLEQGFGFDRCDALIVFAVESIAPARQFAWPAEPYATAEVEGTRVFVLPYDRKSGGSWKQEAEALAQLLKGLSPGLMLQIGAGRPAESTLDLPDAYREARQALIIGSMIHGDKEFCLGYGDLGVKRLLYLMIDHPELERFYEENLSPLLAYDAEWETELVPTLAVYLKEGANLNSAARALFVHRHTLRYRLEQIAEILNVDIDSQEVLLNLQIAFQIGEMKGKT